MDDRERTRTVVLLIVWLGLIALFSTPLPAHDRVSELLFRLARAAGADYSANEIRHVAWFIRKSAHPLVYGVLALIALRFLNARSGVRRGAVRPRLYFMAFAFAVVVGTIDELHQSSVPERSGSAVDVLLDAVGAAVALSVHFVVRRTRAPG